MGRPVIPKCSDCRRVYESITTKTGSPLWGCVICGTTEEVQPKDLPAWKLDRKILAKAHVPLLTENDIPLKKKENE